MELKNVSFCEETLLKHSSEIEISAIALNVTLTKNVTIARGQKQNNCSVSIDGFEIQEGIHFRVATAGTQIVLETVPDSGAFLTITYVHAISLATVTEAVLVGDLDGVNKTFTVPDAGVIYGYYVLLDDVSIVITDTTYA